MSGMERLQRMFAGAGGGLGHQPPDSPTLDSSEQIYISSLAFLKMLKHGRDGVPMEVMGLMLGEFVDEYTVRVVDGLRCRRVVRALVLKLSITYSRLTCSICLNRLDGMVQKLDGEDARIADYFDVISGTSTGGLVTTMLAARDENNRPVFAAKDIKDIYLNQCPRIFLPNSCPVLPHLTKIIKALAGPKYDGKYLHNLVKEKLGHTKLEKTLTNVVIPTFDIKRLQPTIFSSYEVKNNPSMNALLSDICIATSAAPTYLPTYYFETVDPEGFVREFNLTDGGVAANNPALLAIGEVTKQIIRGSSDFFPIKPMDYGRFLVISLGTGSQKAEGKYRSHQASKWGLLDWLTSGGSTPIIDVFSHASADMVDVHLSVVFQALHSEEKYLRIQDDTLVGTVTSVDVATKQNLDDLVKVGEELLKKPVARVNLETGVYEASNHETNEAALTRFAKLLSQERHLRHARSPAGHAHDHQATSTHKTNGLSRLSI